MGNYIYGDNNEQNEKNNDSKKKIVQPIEPKIIHVTAQLKPWVVEEYMKSKQNKP
jgi:hypothetical protein